MKKFNHLITIIVSLYASVILFACNLEDFNMKKLANPDDIVSDMYAPLAYGSFMVQDLVTSPLSATFPVPATGGLSLEPLIISKTGTSFRVEAVDSVYLIIHCTNNTQCNMIISLSFINISTGLPAGRIFTSQPVVAGVRNYPAIFELGPADQDILQKSSDIKLDFTLFSPSGVPLVQYKDVKSKTFSIGISFHAPVNLRKLFNS